jgi:polyferredoxin
MTIAILTATTFIFGGLMREQVCIYMCPWPRIQGAMMDTDTLTVGYRSWRGEPRAKGRRRREMSEEAERIAAAEAERGRGRAAYKSTPYPGAVSPFLADATDDETQQTAPILPTTGPGDCIDCMACVNVCPMGIDIRKGQQMECITCALCIDACDEVMEKVGRPTGLIRYESYESMEANRKPEPLYKRPRVWVYSAIMSLALVGIAYGLTSLAPLELKVLHARQPLFVLQSDGSIQNKYTLKILNKMTEDIEASISASGPKGLILVDADQKITARHGMVTSRTVFVKVPKENLEQETSPIVFTVEGEYDGNLLKGDRQSVFIGPR